MKKSKKTSSSFTKKLILFLLYISAVLSTIQLGVMGIYALIDGQTNGIKPLLIAIVASFILYRIGKKKVQALLDKSPSKSYSSKKDVPPSSSPAKPIASEKPDSMKTTAPAKPAPTNPIVPAKPAPSLTTQPKPRNHASGLPNMPGYTVKYTYDDVHIACSDRYFPIVDLQFDDLLTFKQEPDNPYDDKAVAIYRGEDQLGYLYRNWMQDMVNDWIEKGKPVYGLYEDGIGKESFTIYFYN